MLLHFNFQAIIMVWALWGGTWWVLMALFVDSDLWTPGTRSFGTPRDNCILVAWGCYETQKRLMWTKVGYFIIMYISSFFFSMLHGVLQLRLFNSIDCKMKTMKDFVCMIVGLRDGIKGSDKGVEEELAQTVRSWSGTDVVGASMCWNWKAQEDDCMKALNADLKEKEDAHKAKKRAATIQAGEAVEEEEDPAAVEERVVASYGARRRWYHTMEKKVAEEDDDEELPDMEAMLLEMDTTEDAFIVFATEEDRDKA